MSLRWRTPTQGSRALGSDGNPQIEVDCLGAFNLPVGSVPYPEPGDVDVTACGTAGCRSRRILSEQHTPTSASPLQLMSIPNLRRMVMSPLSTHRGFTHSGQPESRGEFTICASQFMG